MENSIGPKMVQEVIMSGLMEDVHSFKNNVD